MRPSASDRGWTVEKPDDAGTGKPDRRRGGDRHRTDENPGPRRPITPVKRRPRRPTPKLGSPFLENGSEPPTRHRPGLRLPITCPGTADVVLVPQDEQMASLQPATTTAINDVREATARLQSAIDGAIAATGAETMAGRSRLPDWTIGHVVSHLARNADGLRRVLVAAEAGQQVQPYDSPEARVNDIEAGAQTRHRNNCRRSAQRQPATRRHDRRARRGDLGIHRRPRPRWPYHRRRHSGGPPRRG